jgi:hypothetical protein
MQQSPPARILVGVSRAALYLDQQIVLNHHSFLYLEGLEEQNL